MNKYKLSIFDPQAAKLLENITIDKSDFQLQLEEKIENVKEINVSQAAALPASDDEGQFSSSSSSEANQATVEPEKSLEVENLREQAAVASENEEENLEESSPKPNLIFCKYCQIYIPQNEYRQHFKSETCQQNQKKIYENSDNFIGQNETKEPSIKTNLNNVNLETIPSDFQNNPNRLTKYDIQRSQKLFLRAHFRHEFDDQRVTPGPLITIYRHVVSPKGELPTHAELISRIKNLHEDKNQKILILLHAGGHFAIALYNNGECIKHKTFRAYIVRGKAGGVQAQADKRQGAHKSVGAQLRRTNQVHFEEKISTLLKSWKEENIFTECSLKLLHVPHYARKLYFNDHAFDKEDTSVRSIPFSTVKPGMAECSRVFTELFSLCIWSNNEIETVKLKKKVAHGSPKLDLEALRISSVADCDITQEEVLNINKQKKSEYQNLKKLKTLENTISSDEEELKPFTSDFNKNVPKPSISVEGPMALSNCLDQLLPEKTLLKKLRRQRRLSSNETQEELENLNTSIENLSKSIRMNSRSSSKSRSRSTSESNAENSNISVFHICANGNLDDLHQLNSIIPAEIWIHQPLDSNGRLPLHVATRAGNIKVIKKLLYDYQANPELNDNTLQTAYESAKDKNIRNIFRIFRHEFPEKFDYKKAKIDDPISVEDLDKMKTKKKSKAKNKKKSTTPEKPQPPVEEKKPELPKLSEAEIMRQKRLDAINRRLGKL